MHLALPFTLVALGLGAAAPQEPGKAPGIAWRGAVWASGAVSNRGTEEGMFLRSMDAGEGQVALDGLQLGAEARLGKGWALTFTFLAGQTAKVLNSATLSSGSTRPGEGSIAFPEAMITWAGTADTLAFGRMYTPMGMEVADQSQDLAASRGLLFTYAVPFTQLGLKWHHVFSASWSWDLWVHNGEDRLRDNNRGKTAGMGVTYNHLGDAARFLTLMAFRGAEQDDGGSLAVPGALGRKRERLSFNGQWVWGPSTLQGEVELARETLPMEALAGAPATTTWSGAGVIYGFRFDARWAAFGRLEVFRDSSGLRLGFDPTVAATVPPAPGLDLEARSLCLGLERKWKAAFARIEARMDRLNREVREGSGRAFRDAGSLTGSVGGTF